jgi:hypothetical protein
MSFIGFLFILFQCLPDFVKLMSSPGPYDIALQNVDESAIHGSLNKDYDIAIIDGVQDTRIETGISKQKRLLKGIIDN